MTTDEAREELERLRLRVRELEQIVSADTPDGVPPALVEARERTLRSELEAQRLQTRNMESLGHLAGAMAHDFNNLLTVIGVHVALLRRRRDGIELVEVATAVERAAELTRQLVAFSQRTLREAAPADPSTIVRDAAAVARRIVEEDVVTAPPASELPSVPPTSQGKGHLILLVEDNGAIRRVLTTILIEAGFRVEAAADAEAALGLYLPRPGEFAALVTDVVMPGMGGPQLVRHLRGVTPDLPVLYLSGYAREKGGADDIETRGALLKKPFLPAELVDKVVELLDQALQAEPER